MTLSPGYFDQLYAASADPWGLASRWYETRKYAISLAMLPEPHYQHAFEPGCSIGVLTRLLAPRCGQLLACDAAAAAVRSAAARTESAGNVLVQQRALSRDWPPGRFDLIVFSEFLYYFDGDDLGLLLSKGTAALRPGGSLLAVHWRHRVADYPRSGDEVHRVLADHPKLARLVSHEEPDFLADVYIRADGRPVSVAEAGGLA
jgi:SAM-dependent methyltransferase